MAAQTNVKLRSGTNVLPLESFVTRYAGMGGLLELRIAMTEIQVYRSQDAKMTVNQGRINTGLALEGIFRIPQTVL